MSAIRTAVVYLVCACLSGCSLVEFAVGEHRVDPVGVLKEELQLPAPDALGKREPTIMGKAIDVPKTIDLENYRLWLTSRTTGPNPARIWEVQTADERNEWMTFLIQRAEEHCDYHKAAIIASHSTVNGMFGVAATVLGGSGALVTGATAARVLSGLAGMVTGMRSQYNEVFYQNLIASAVVRRIDELRDAQRAALFDKIRDTNTADIKKYTVRHVVLDVNRYHYLCSFYVGLVALTDDKQRLAPLAQSLDAQINVTRDAIDRYKTEIKSAETAASTSDYAKERLKTLYASLSEMERQLRSLETQRAVAVAHGARVAPLSIEKPADKPADDKSPADAADAAKKGT